jgi:protein phosphatase PTC7
MVSPMILGVADGVSQIEQYGIDASLLPRELLRHCESLGMRQLIPDKKLAQKDSYQGPIPLLRQAFKATKNLGSTTVVLAVLDNSTMIHGKRHPMIAAITVGDCEMLVLRRVETEGSNLFEIIFHTEMQRIDGHAQSPLQLARVDGRIDPNFTDAVTVEVIERGSAVHCVSAYEGDVVIMGSDGVFDNLFLDEIIHLSNSILQPGMGSPLPQEALAHLSRAIVMASHSKSQRQANGRLPECQLAMAGRWTTHLWWSPKSSSGLRSTREGLVRSVVVKSSGDYGPVGALSAAAG